MPRRNFPEWIFSEFPVLANAMDFVKTEFCVQVFPAGVLPGFSVRCHPPLLLLQAVGLLQWLVRGLCGAGDRTWFPDQTLSVL